MAATQILDPLPGEDLLAIEPELLQQVDAGWLQRLSLFTGRALSDTALTNEQAYRAGRLTLLGQAVTQGTVQGLELSVDLTAADPILLLSPGYGIAASGQDVALLRPIRTTLSGLAVLDGDSGNYIADFKTFSAPTAPWTGIFLLQPFVVAVTGSAVDTGTTNLIVSGNLAASCDQDPTQDAFDDSQIVDGARLVLVTWPATSSPLVLPPATPSATWRNRLAYTIFNTEITLSADNFFPWEFYGAPLALAGFDASSKLLFADRSAVVRSGGLPRRRYLRPFQQTLAAVQPALANARVNQFAEQVGEDMTPTSPSTLIPNEFVFLPPAGILPAYVMDFPNRKALWCPSNWSATARPIFAEELEGEIQRSMTAAPLETAQSETIDILIPLPDAVYDANILLTEVASPEFQDEIDAVTLQRNIVLQHRFVIQQEANALAPLLNQPLIDPQSGLIPDESAELTATPVFSPLSSETFGTTLSNETYISTELQTLQQTAAAAPYVVTANGTQIPLFNADDWNDLTTNGIQHFIDRINAKLSDANDILDLAFLTAQTDIYRYRQNVLNTSDASRLAVSPILANIASGDTAAATAQNIRDYLTSIQPAATPAVGTADLTATMTSRVVSDSLRARPAAIRNISPTARVSMFINPNIISTNVVPTVFPTPFIPPTFNPAIPIQEVAAQPSSPRVSETFTGINLQAVSQVPVSAAPVDITQQSPVVGAQLNLRTLTIAERLAPSPAQEAMFYSVGNRVAILQLLADLEITIDDLPVLLDTIPSVPQGYIPPQLPLGVTGVYLGDLRSAANVDFRTAIIGAVNAPSITTPSQLTATINPDESTLFSTGVHVLEQNTQLLRAIEARIQQYQDFLSLAAASLSRIQASMSAAQSLLTQLGNDLTNSRQDLAFVQALFNDEQTRVANLNAQRANVLSQYVTFIAYVRPRTVDVGEEAPSRQLIPANVSSPVPACLNQTVAVPPELREIVSLLREAPIRWFPPILAQLPKLERPPLLLDLAASTQTRASVALQLPAPVSSAESSNGLFGAAISNIFATNQQTMRTLQTARASFNASTLINQSWTAQVNLLGSLAAVGDLLNSPAVHPEITSAASASLQQISTVATCLYTRVSQTLPVDRLEWATFLNNGAVSLRNLAVLPGWNTQNYVDRQQMQLVVDWLYQQIDSSDSTAVSLMDDLIATAILLASQAPVDDIIAGAVALRTIPFVGGPIRLTLPSDRVAHGMTVQLYSAGELAAKAVVSDLDGSSVNATVTDVFKPNVALEANDVAHFSGLNQNAIVYRAFSR